MGHSSLIGIERAAALPSGRDTAALGPGDTSDSGSDLAGVDQDLDDPNLPVDVALREDASRSAIPPEVMSGGASDAGGTGERRSAGSDAGSREAADIGVDRVFTPGAESSQDEDNQDADLDMVDEALDGEGGMYDEDDGIPGSEPVDTGPVDPDRPARPQTPEPTPGGHEPKGPGALPGAPSGDPDDEDAEDREPRKPGRDF